MTVPARSLSGSTATDRGTLSVGTPSAIALSLLALLAPVSARAQLGASIDVESDYRLRGYSLSAGRPTATGRLGYDSDIGIYASVSATGALARDTIRFIGTEAAIGYAKRISPETTLDGGILRSDYRPSYAGGRNFTYTEIYLGMSNRHLRARVSLSPDYFEPGNVTLYGEAEATIDLARNLHASLHVGSLAYVSAPAGRDSRPVQYDWRLGASRAFGAFEVHAALTGGGPGSQYYEGREHRRTALTAGGSWSF